MSRLALDIDHVGLVGPHIHATVAAFRKLGFRVTEPVELMGAAPGGGEQSLGQHSAHLIFGTTYVELSEVTRPGPDHHLSVWLGDGHALSIVILRTDNIDAVRERALDAGQCPTPVGEASRSLRYANGATARFRWLALAPESFPEALCGYVQHLTPELVFWPAMNDHANGAVELTGMTLHTPDVGNAERRFALLGRLDAPEHLDIRPAGSGPTGFTALQLRTRSLAQTAEALRTSAQPFERTAGSIRVEAPGVRLIFAEQSSTG